MVNCLSCGSFELESDCCCAKAEKLRGARKSKVASPTARKRWRLCRALPLLVLKRLRLKWERGNCDILSAPKKFCCGRYVNALKLGLRVCKTDLPGISISGIERNNYCRGQSETSLLM